MRSSRDIALGMLHVVVALATLLWLVAQGLVLGAALGAGKAGVGVVAIGALMVLTAVALGLLVAGAVSLWQGGRRARGLALAYAGVGVVTGIYVFAVGGRALLSTALLAYPVILIVVLARAER